MLSLFARGVLLIAGLASVGMVFYAADSAVAAVAFAAWVASPYYFLYRATRKSYQGIVHDGVIFLASLGAAIPALWIYSDGFFIHPDPQSGLLFVFIPLWQWCGVGVVMLALQLWSKWVHR